MRGWLVLGVLLCGMLAWAQGVLPVRNGLVEIIVPDWEGRSDRPAQTLRLHLYYPKGALAQVTAETGLMLDLHNWGGVTFDGAPNPDVLANAYNVIAIGVEYFQSGDKDQPTDPPYDFGCRQAIDALRGLQFIAQALRAERRPFDATRIYGCGGSGGGNVIQMANKLAPRAFACIVDLSGMASLTDDMAYREPGGSALKARYSRDPASPAYLSKGMQEIRDLGHPAHLALQVAAKAACAIVVIHGLEDGYCLAADKRRVTDAMTAAGLAVDAHFLGKTEVDGKIVLNPGHSLGNRTTLLQHFAGSYLAPGSPTMRRLAQPLAFTDARAMRFPVSDGVYAVTYPGGLPCLGFTPAVAR